MTEFRANDFVRNYYFVILLLAILSFSALYFVQPRWVENQSVTVGPVQYGMNPDSPNWVRTVVGFPDYFKTEYGKIRVQRPLYSFLGWITFRGITPLKPLIPAKIVQKVDSKMKNANHPERWSEVNPSRIILGWLSCILVNLLLYWFGAILLYKSLIRYFSAGLSLLLTFVPLLHINSLHFYLMPHSEAFNFLIPALSVYVIVQFVEAKTSPKPWTWLLGITLLGKSLIYPLINYCYEFFTPQSKATKWSQGVLLLFVAVIPTLVYQLFLNLSSYPTYHHEIEKYRQLVWMLDAWNENRIWSIPLRWTLGLGAHTVNVVQGFFVPVLCLGFCGIMGRQYRQKIPREFFEHLILYAVTCAMFWSFIGYHEIGNALTQFPLIVFSLGYFVSTRFAKPHWVIMSVLSGQIVCYYLGIFVP